MEKKRYVAPSMEVIALKLQGSLLTGSGKVDSEGPGSMDKHDFEDDWK